MSHDLKPWYAVATPHEDIRAGRLDEAVFAANVWAVVQKTAPEVYLDPEEFFRKPYMAVFSVSTDYLIIFIATQKLNFPPSACGIAFAIEEFPLSDAAGDSSSGIRPGEDSHGLHSPGCHGKFHLGLAK